MAVAYNGSAVFNKLTGGSTSATFSYTVGSGSDRLLLAQSGGTANTSAVTYAGAALTSVGSATGSLKTWQKTSPATGPNNFVFTVSTYASFRAGVADFSGVDQTTPLGSQVSNTATGSSASTGSITVPADGAAWGGIITAFATTGTVTMSSGTLGTWEQISGLVTANGYRLSTGNLVWSLPSSPQWWAQGFPINPVAGPSDLSGEAILSGITADGGMATAGSSELSGEAILTGITADGGMGLAPGVITTPVLKNNTGTILASVSGIVANVYHPTTGALVVRKTGLSSDGSGVVTISDVLLVPGTTYAYELDLSATTQGRRLPTGVAA